MSDTPPEEHPPGWRPMSVPTPGREAFDAPPFTCLARSHAMAVAGDTLVAIALAGSLFFSIDPNESRRQVFLYLALTMAPFAVVAPLVGPALDRTPGGRRWMVVGSSGLRAFLCLLLIRDVDTLFLFPEALGLLVLAKSYHVAKSALVPAVVESDEALVEANSKLSIISGLVGFVAAIPGGLFLVIGESEMVLAAAMVVFAAGVPVALAIPRVQVADTPVSEEERHELRSAGVLLAASAMGLLRGVVGFMTFLVAFSLRTGDAPSWHFGVVLALSAVGSLTGAAIAPVLRKNLSEERIITIVLVALTLLALLGAWAGGLVGVSLVAGSVGVAASCSRLAFDSIVQRDAPDANRGRSFARFETRFQLIWVAGALLGLIAMPAWLGFLLVAGTAGFAAASYQAGVHGADRFGVRRLAARFAGAGADASPHRQVPPAGEAPTRQLLAVGAQRRPAAVGASVADTPVELLVAAARPVSAPWPPPTTDR